MIKNYSYPNPEDDNFQKEIYEKREFYFNRTEPTSKFDNYDDLKQYRESVCSGEGNTLQAHQASMKALFNQNTPYRGCLMYWDTGSGKTRGAIAAMENFKEMVQRYGTKMYILVPGRLHKDNWKREILSVTQDVYLQDVGVKIGYVGEGDKKNAVQKAKENLSQYYKIMTHVSFFKRVLGNKLVEYAREGNKTVKIFRKTGKGEFERDIVGERIERLDNTILVIDEAHNLTENSYGLAIKKIVAQSKNLRVFVLSATPMKNHADEIIELVNYIRPQHDPIIRSLVFNNESNHLMAFKEGGKEYLGKMLQGYVSHVAGVNPNLYAKQIDMGDIHKDLMFTHVTECIMHPFQEATYWKAMEDDDGVLQKKVMASTNFAFPIYNIEKKDVTGTYGIEGMQVMKGNIKAYNKQLVTGLKTLGVKGDNNIIMCEGRNMCGRMLNMENIGIFSSKFKKALDIIYDELIKGGRTGFLYSNVVQYGVDLFAQVLLENGWLEYNESGSYPINDKTIHYLTGDRYGDWVKKKKGEKFIPAVFISITGGIDGDKEGEIPEEKARILGERFSVNDNIDGKIIKIVLGSKVMTEGMTLKNIKAIIVLDTAFHLGQITQVIGRGIRFCVHNAVATESNPYPEVNVYKLIVKSKKDAGKLSVEGILYQKAELKYLLVKDVERVIKENAIDCALNYNVNIQRDVVNKHKNCISPSEWMKLGIGSREKHTQCPQTCDFQHCLYTCKSAGLNMKHYDKDSMMYKKITKENLDFTTFTAEMAQEEIKKCKENIKNMYKLKYVYYLDEILEYCKENFGKVELFEEFFCFKALDELLPVSENDFNNFNSPVYDKLNVPGYLIYRNGFYIFQPLHLSEDVPLYYRKNYLKDLKNEISVNEYFMQKGVSIKKNEDYDFESNFEYYDSKSEAKYVGVIDKSKGGIDVFKLREKRNKEETKKRGVGIPTLKGTVCGTSKDKSYLEKVMSYLGIKKKTSSGKRDEICGKIRLKMLFNEKYEEGDKIWMIIPSNHPTYPFPFNLKDRVDKIIGELEVLGIKGTVKKLTNGIFEGIREKDYVKYKICFNGEGSVEIHTDRLIGLGFVLENNAWSIIIE